MRMVPLAGNWAYGYRLDVFCSNRYFHWLLQVAGLGAWDSVSASFRGWPTGQTFLSFVQCQCSCPDWRKECRLTRQFGLGWRSFQNVINQGVTERALADRVKRRTTYWMVPTKSRCRWRSCRYPKSRGPRSYPERAHHWFSWPVGSNCSWSHVIGFGV